VSERGAEVWIPLHCTACRGWSNMLLLRRACAPWRKDLTGREDAQAQAVLKAV